MNPVTERTARAYAAAFQAEREVGYPAIDTFEARTRYSLERERLENAAAILACPLKVHSPNWQHGRVIYSVVRGTLAQCLARVLLLDIGTAKGFSALCLLWAMQDAHVSGQIVSVDVIEPRSRESRNSVAELDSPKTLTELLAPWPEADVIHFLQSTGIAWLESYRARIHVAFVDGKHDELTVRREASLLRERQSLGDVIMFDDLQIPGVARAVTALEGPGGYRIERLVAKPERQYAIARRT
jgi:predicted O-methyltransferase YrrM